MHHLRKSHRRGALLTAMLLVAGVFAVPSRADEAPAPGLPADGFSAALYTLVDGVPTSVAVGPDGRVYATVAAPDFTAGWVTAWDDLGGIAGPGRRVADGLQLPMGLTFGPDGTLYVSENAGLDVPNARGRVTALTDTDADGVFDDHQTVIANIPNGRHQTNGLTFGPDGLLYLANGSATDDGVECGPAGSTTCANPEVQPWTGAILKADPSWREVDLLVDTAAGNLAIDDVLVARGMRNIYGAAFRPSTSSLYTVMNGADDPSSSEPIYRTEVTDGVIDDMGFPMCLYDPHDNQFPVPQIGGHQHPGDTTPKHNPNPVVRDQYGLCPIDTVTRPLGFASAHAGSGGVKFIPPGDFPAAWVGDLVYAEWGSIWNLNSGEPTGHKVFVHEVNDDGTLAHNDDGTQLRHELLSLPLPIDVAFDGQGVLFVADQTGGIYRVEYSGG